METYRNGSDSKKFVITAVVIVLLLVASVGGYYYFQVQKENREIESFQKEVDQFKAVKNDYKLGSLKNDYDSLLSQGNTSIEERKLSRFDSLSSDMEKLISEVKKQDEQIEGYEQKMKAVNSTVGVYSMSTAKRADFQSIIDSYKEAIDECDTDECKDAEKRAQSFLKDLVKQNAKVKVKTKTKVVVKTVKEKSKEVVHQNSIAVSDYSGYQSEFVFWDSNSRYLSGNEISGLTAWELKIARNEIYARRGRQFNSHELQEYFNGCSWYQGTIPASSFNSNVLNLYENANVKLIRSYEKAIGIN